MNARYSAVFAAFLVISCSEAQPSPLAQAGAPTATGQTQTKSQPASVSADSAGEASAGSSHHGESSGSPAAKSGIGVDGAPGSAANSSSTPPTAASDTVVAGAAPPTAASAAGAPATAGVAPPTAASDAGVADAAPPTAASDAGAAGGASKRSDAATSDASTASDPVLCPDGFPRGTASSEARKLLALAPSPEGVTMCPNGQVFLSLDDGQIVRVAPENPAPEPWTTLPGIEPAGISCDEHNQLFIAVYAVRSGSAKPGIMRIAAQGAQGTLLPAPAEASPLAAYNGILAIAGQGVYATDSGAGWVVHTHETTPGEYITEIVARDIPIANGLAYDTAHHKLYVVSSLDFAVYTFDLAADGTLQNRTKVITSSASFFDGVAVDENGEVYAADYSGNQLVRLSDAKVIVNLPTPASLTFRGGTLLITDYRLNQPQAEGGLYAIDLGACSGQRLQ